MSHKSKLSSANVRVQDHIGLKHLRNNDLDANMLHELKTTKHLKGAERYKAIYAKLFPGDELGIRNPCALRLMFLDHVAVAHTDREQILTNTTSQAPGMKEPNSSRRRVL